MKNRDLFEVLVRVIGVWELVSGLEILPHWIATFSHPPTFAKFPIAEIVTMLGSSGLKIVGGVALYYLARPLAKYTFPDDQSPSDHPHDRP